MDGTGHIEKPETVEQKCSGSKAGSRSQDKCNFRAIWPLGDVHSLSPTPSSNFYPQGEILVKD